MKTTEIRKNNAKNASDTLLFLAPKLNLSQEQASACLMGVYAINQLEFIKEVLKKEDLSDSERISIIKFHAFALENGVFELQEENKND